MHLSLNIEANPMSYSVIEPKFKIGDKVQLKENVVTTYENKIFIIKRKTKLVITHITARVVKSYETVSINIEDYYLYTGRVETDSEYYGPNLDLIVSTSQIKLCKEEKKEEVSAKLHAPLTQSTESFKKPSKKVNKNKIANKEKQNITSAELYTSIP